MILQLNLDFQHIYCIITSTPLHNAGPNITWYKHKIVLKVTIEHCRLLHHHCCPDERSDHISSLPLVQFAFEIHLILATVCFISILTLTYIIFIFTSKGGKPSQTFRTCTLHHVCITVPTTPTYLDMFFVFYMLSWIIFPQGWRTYSQPGAGSHRLVKVTPVKQKISLCGLLHEVWDKERLAGMCSGRVYLQTNWTQTC